MAGDRTVGQEAERVAMGVGALILLGFMCRRLWLWHEWPGAYKTVWEAVAGKRSVATHFFPFGRFADAWDFGFWELCPDGQLAAAAMLVLIASLALGAIVNDHTLHRMFCLLGGGLVVGGLLVNAVLFLRLMAAY